MSNYSGQAHLVVPAQDTGVPNTPPVKAVTTGNESFGHIAPDCAGLNFYDIDKSFQASLRVNMDPKVLAHFEPIIQRLGGVAGNELDALARKVDMNPPVLEQRDRFGRDLATIVYHPAYREMEKIGFEDFQCHTLCHQPNAHGWGAPAPQAVKYAFHYLFTQSEFGMMCPLSITDATIHVLRTFASEELKNYLLPKMMEPKLDDLWKGTQFMTERAGGSDVGTLETTARFENGVWRLYGDKWFASHTDAAIALILARPEGAPEGIKGVAMFALPRYLADGSRNSYRIVRLKEKLGTKSLASCEIVLEGAEAYLVGRADQGIKQMMEQVNMSRLSHGVRAAGHMRRCYNEAMAVARNRNAFGSRIIEHPLLRRQVIKILVPAEQALAMSMLAAKYMDEARAGSVEAAQLVRIMTPLIKFRACRDAIKPARASMETRGGNGYIEEWVNARLVRDSHIGVLWEGTSNINAIDVVRRAVGKSKAHINLNALLLQKIEELPQLPEALRQRLLHGVQRSFQFISTVGSSAEHEHMARQATTAFYNAASAVVLAWEGSQQHGDPRKVLLSRFVLEHRVEPIDPMAPPNGDWEKAAYVELFKEDCEVTLKQACTLLAL